MSFMIQRMVKYFLTLNFCERMNDYMLQGIIPFAHELLKKAVKKGDLVVDATCGNGNDTLLLSEFVESHGRVYAFDIQQQAIETTKQLLAEHERKNVILIQDSHANIDQYIKEDEEISAAVFNLGYLPRSDKKIITKPDSTLQALEKLLQRLKKNGLIVLVVYAGHPGGLEEKNAVLNFVTTLDQKQYSAVKYQFINLVNNPPFVIAIEKKQ